MKRNKGNPFYDGGLDPLILIAKNLSHNLKSYFLSLVFHPTSGQQRQAEDLGIMLVMLCRIPPSKHNKI